MTPSVRCVLLLAGVSGYLGCRAGTAISRTQRPSPPTMEYPLTCVASATVTISGTKASGASVWFWREGEEAAAVQVAPTPGTTFAFDLLLDEGANTFSIDARFDTLRSDPLAASVCRDTIAPSAPLYDGTLPAKTSAHVLALAGTKDAGANVCLRVDDEDACDEVVAIDELTTWSASVVLTTAEHELCIRSADAAGNDSDETCTNVTILGYPLTIVSDNAPTIAPATDPKMAVDELGRLHFVWADSCSVRGAPADENNASTTECTIAAAIGLNPPDIFYRVFDGLDWSDIHVVADADDGASNSPDVAVDAEGQVHIVWVDAGDINGAGIGADPLGSIVTRRIDAFDTLDALDSSFDDLLSDTDVLAAYSDGFCETLDAEADSFGSLHLVYSQSKNVYYRRWDAAWSDAIEVSNPNGSGFNVGPVVHGDTIARAHVAWRIYGSADDTDGIWYRRVESTGVNLGPLASLSSGPASAPALAVDDNFTVYVAWVSGNDEQDAGTDDDVWLRTLNGLTMAQGDTVLIAGDSSADPDGQPSNLPTLTVDSDDTLHIVWIDQADFDGDGQADPDVVYVNYRDGDFSDPVVLSDPDDNIGTSWAPDVRVTDDGIVHVSWQDQTAEGNATDDDIYYYAFLPGAL